MLLYCDSVILIYFLENTGPLNARAVNWLAGFEAAGDHVAISDLTRLECRVKPLQLKNTVALRLFDQYFQQANVRCVPLTTAVFDRATGIRADGGFQTTDALHLAAAVEARCDRFLTNDTRLARFSDIPVEIMP
jgi:predicted nucleic acid-binding protein